METFNVTDAGLLIPIPEGSGPLNIAAGRGSPLWVKPGGPKVRASAAGNSTPIAPSETVQLPVDHSRRTHAHLIAAPGTSNTVNVWRASAAAAPSPNPGAGPRPPLSSKPAPATGNSETKKDESP